MEIDRKDFLKVMGGGLLGLVALPLVGNLPKEEIAPNTIDIELTHWKLPPNKWVKFECSVMTPADNNCFTLGLRSVPDDCTLNVDYIKQWYDT